ncbi:MULTISPECIES: hypothetical protein [Novosphingobium]|nr:MULTISPECIES: hypothetical protein [Novosphingobium]WQD92892.1 hypothetical protein U0041_18230 [Novosphingobium capsulatum]
MTSGFFKAAALALCVAAPLGLGMPVAVAQTAAKALPANTMVQLTPEAEISSKKINLGDKVGFAVVNDVTDGGQVVIPRGSHVEGAITFKTGKAIGGKSGKFEVTFEKITVGGKTYAMKGTHRQEGKGNTVAAVFGSMLVSGRSAVMLPGDFANAFTNEPIPY